MIKGMIFTIESGESYYVVEELEYENHKYALGLQCDLETDQVINQNELVLFEVVAGDELELRPVDDEKFADKIASMIVEKMRRDN